MLLELIQYSIQGLAVIGGISGLKIFIDWIKNKQAKLVVKTSIANYSIPGILGKHSLLVNVTLLVENQKNEAVYLTDALGLLAEYSRKALPKKPETFSAKAHDFSPVEIKGRTTTPLNLMFNFQNIETVKALRRVGIGYFGGFLNGTDVPVLIAKEVDFDTKWDSLPLEMDLVLHLNGKDPIEDQLVVFSDTVDSGTLSPVDVEKARKKYSEHYQPKTTFQKIKPAEEFFK